MLICSGEGSLLAAFEPLSSMGASMSWCQLVSESTTLVTNEMIETHQDLPYAQTTIP